MNRSTTKAPRKAYGYLICAEEPIGNREKAHGMARHYAGIAGNVQRRYLDHCSGRGAHLTRAFVQRGIPMQLVQIWTFTDSEQGSAWEQARAWEHAIKSHKQHRDFCPRCQAKLRQQSKPEAQPQTPRAGRAAERRPAYQQQPLLMGMG